MKNYAEIYQKIVELRELDRNATIDYQINRCNGIPGEFNDIIQEAMDYACGGYGFLRFRTTDTKVLNLLVQAGFTPVALKEDGMFKLTLPRPGK